MKTPFFPPRVAWPWLLAGVAAGLGIGGFAGWRLALEHHSGAETAAAVLEARAEEAGPPAPFREAAQARETAFQKAAAFADTLPLGENLRDSLRALEKVNDPEQRRLAWQAFLRRLPKERWGEMEKALDGHNDDGDFYSAVELLSLFAEHISRVDPAAALLKEGEEDNPLDEMSSQVFLLWAKRDMAAAEAFFHAVDTEKEIYADVNREELASHLAKIKAKTDPQAALAWISQLPEEVRNNAYVSAFSLLNQDNPAEAARLLTTTKNWFDQQSAAFQIAKRWAETEPKKALNWAATLPPEMAILAMSAPASALAAKDFDVVWARVDQAPSPAHAIGLLQGLADALPPGKEAEFAAAWAKTAAEEALQTNAGEVSRPLMAQWVHRDAEAASGWLAGLPQGNLRDAAIVSFVHEMAKDGDDLAAAAEWAAVIGGERERRSSLHDAVGSWASNNPYAARAWVQENPRLAPEDRERLLPLTLVESFRRQKGDAGVSNAIDGLLSR